MAPDPRSFVCVQWDDAEDSFKAWMDEEDVAAFSTHTCTVVSVGYLISRTDKYVTLGGDWIEELHHWGRVTKIPVSMVVRIVTLVEGEPLS